MSPTRLSWAALQIDKFGNSNLIGVGKDYKHLEFRGPGAVGTLSMAHYVDRYYLFVQSHNKRIFVDKCDFISTVGWGQGGADGRTKLGIPGNGPVYCITPLCVFDFEENSKRMRLRSVHPGVTVAQVLENTGFEVIVPDHVPVTTAPTPDEIWTLRERIDIEGMLRSLAERLEVKLLEPITFANGRLRSKNRVVMPPMGMGYAHEDGRVSDKVIEYYRARARSGVGMMVVENCIVDPDVLGVGPELQLHSEIHLPGLQRLADVIKGFGAIAGLQLNHMGRQTTLGKPVAPSPIPISERGPAPRVLDLSDIQFVIDEFVRAAAWVKQTGFDFVELHGAHGYLMCEFLSPVSNRRDDEFGGDFERRLTFPLRDH